MLVAPRGRDCAKRHVVLIGPPPQASAVVPRPKSLRFALTLGLRFKSAREDAMRPRRVTVQRRVRPAASERLKLFRTSEGQRRGRLTLGTGTVVRMGRAGRLGDRRRNWQTSHRTIATRCTHSLGPDRSATVPSTAPRHLDRRGSRSGASRCRSTASPGLVPTDACTTTPARVYLATPVPAFWLLQ